MPSPENCGLSSTDFVRAGDDSCYRGLRLRVQRPRTGVTAPGFREDPQPRVAATRKYSSGLQPVRAEVMAHNWRTTRGDSLVANRRQNKGCSTVELPGNIRTLR